MRKISESQQLALELMRRGSFSYFDGDQVADDLLAHSDLWLACWWGDHDMPIRSLADLALHDSPFVTTVYLLTTEDHWKSLVQLAQNWEYTEITVFFQASREVLLIKDGKVRPDNPLIRLELEEYLGYELDELGAHLDTDILVVISVWWDLV
ncbi:MAG: hypothetical protein K6U77_09830 [Armatimonadetes bacterium]|jgi:hypothetical protein|nr:hypothetical protein [Armatimonadota bacterium]